MTSKHSLPVSEPHGPTSHHSPIGVIPRGEAQPHFRTLHRPPHSDRPTACLPSQCRDDSLRNGMLQEDGGNCDMGGDDHKCCDMTVNHSAPTAAVAQNSTPHAVIPYVLEDILGTTAALPEYGKSLPSSSSIQITSSPPGS